MMSVALSPLRQQGDVSRILTVLPAVLLQDSGAPPAATPSHVQGPSSPPTATLACTQGLGTPLSDTLAHSYAPCCTSGLSPCLDRKSTRLNSSHSQISYAVFCLKKKKQITI